MEFTPSTYMTDNKLSRLQKKAALDKAPHRVRGPDWTNLQGDRVALVRRIGDRVRAQGEGGEGGEGTRIGMGGAPRIVADAVDIPPTARTAEIPQDVVKRAILHEYDHDVLEALDIGWHTCPPQGQGYDTHQRLQGHVDEASQDRCRPRASQTTREAACATFLDPRAHLNRKVRFWASFIAQITVC